MVANSMRSWTRPRVCLDTRPRVHLVLSLVRDGRLTPDSIWELKTQAVKKSGLLTLHRGGADFDAIGGLTSFKAFTRGRLLRRGES